MADFPPFVKNPRNRISTASQLTDDIEGWLFDGADETQVALWTCSADRSSAPHAHAFDEYVVILEGRATVTTSAGTTVLEAGDEHLVPRGTLQEMAVVAGTRTMHVFGGKRAVRAIMRPSLSYLVVPCAELERSRAFYAALGLEPTRERHGGGPEHYAIDVGGVVLELYAKPPEQRGAMSIGLRVPSVAAATSAAVEAGGTLRSMQTDPPRAIVVDPDGHTLALAE